MSKQSSNWYIFRQKICQIEIFSVKTFVILKYFPSENSSSWNIFHQKFIKLKKIPLKKFVKLKYFPPIFIQLKVTCLVTLFDCKLQAFKNSPKWTMFSIFNQFLSTQNVNVARLARNVECDLFYDFQTLWCSVVLVSCLPPPLFFLVRLVVFLVGNSNVKDSPACNIWDGRY